MNCKNCGAEFSEKPSDLRARYKYCVKCREKFKKNHYSHKPPNEFKCEKCGKTVIRFTRADGIKFCVDCKKQVLIDKVIRYQQKNKDRLEQKRRKKKELVDSLKIGLLCLKCNKLCTKEIVDQFCFHHRDPTTKIDGIGRMTNDSIETIKNEIKKCDFMCRICHRKYHSTGESNPAAKLTELQVKEIRELHSKGLGCMKISRMFGISKSTTKDIFKRKIWNHI